MAERTSTGELELEAMTVAEEKELEAEVSEDSDQPVVKPKEHKSWNEGCLKESQEALFFFPLGTGIAQSLTGNWWHSSALMDCGPRDANTPSHWSAISGVEREKMD